MSSSPRERPLLPDVLVARRAALQLAPRRRRQHRSCLPAPRILSCCPRRGARRGLAEFSIGTGHLGGVVNGLGFRSNTRAVLDTPAIFSLYGSGLVQTAFFSMLEFDAEGSVNLLRYGDIWVGPGGSMDIAHAVKRIVFCGTFRAGGLAIEAGGGQLRIASEGAVPRGVDGVQGVCFGGKQMLRQGKEVLYVTERAVFRLTEAGPNSSSSLRASNSDATSSARWASARQSPPT